MIDADDKLPLTRNDSNQTIGNIDSNTEGEQPILLPNRWHSAINQNNNNNLEPLSLGGESVVIVLVDDKTSTIKRNKLQNNNNSSISNLSSFGGGGNNGTLRRKSQMITFSTSNSSCDIKNSLSHEIIPPSPIQCQQMPILSPGTEAAVILKRTSFIDCAEEASEDLPNDLIEDLDVFHTNIEEEDEEEEVNDSGGGSYEDSNPMQGSGGSTSGSHRNSLEKDDDDDVISTDVSCYDQLIASTKLEDAGVDEEYLKKGGGVYANPFLGNMLKLIFFFFNFCNFFGFYLFFNYYIFAQTKSYNF